MDQLTIIAQIDALIAQAEQMIDTRYAQLQRKTMRAVEKTYDAYGQDGSLSLAQLYAYYRAQLFLRQLDNDALIDYELMLKALVQAQETIFKTTFLSLVYLIEQFFPDKKPLLKLTKKQMTDSIQLTLIESLQDLLTRYKNDYVFQNNNDFKQHVQGEGNNYTQFKAKIKKRVQASREYLKQRIVEMFESVSNAAREMVFQATKGLFETEKVWLSKRDMKVRQTHRFLDGQIADKKGYFHLGGMKAKYPRTWAESRENYGCRCVVFMTFNKKMPKVMRGLDYRDEQYQRKLAKRIDELLPNMTLKQAIEQAQKDIQPPEREIPFMSYADWLKAYGEIN